MVVYPHVAGYTQERERCIKWNPLGNGCKTGIPVGKVAGVFPEEVPDKRLCQPSIAGMLQRIMLQFADHPSQIQYPNSQRHPFQVNNEDPEAVAAEDIGGRHIPVDENLAVFPHIWLLPPVISESVKFTILVMSQTPSTS